MTQIIALAMQKGGVGKTTSAFHIARCAVLAGLRTLVVDLDSQGNLTLVATKEPYEPGNISIADVLATGSDVRLSEVIVPGVWDGLDVAPSPGEPLGVVRDQLVIAGGGREFRLREALAEVKDDYDLILLDLAPSLDLISGNALAASDKVLVVSSTDAFAESGLHLLLDNIATTKAYYNPALETVGILVNAHESRTINGREWTEILQEVADARDVTVLEPAIPRARSIADATYAATGLDQWKDRHKTGPKYAALYEQHFKTLMEGAAR